MAGQKLYSHLHVEFSSFCAKTCELKRELEARFGGRLSGVNTNYTPENERMSPQLPFQKESSLPTINFQGIC